MTRRCLRTGLALISLLWMTTPGRAEPASRLLLNNGAILDAPILKTTDEAYFVDLGEDVLRLPKETVRALKDPGEWPASAEEDEERSLKVDPDKLFGTRTRRTSDTVENWSNALGEAVVEIRSRSGQGSGFLINDRGYIITNYHVIARDRELSVTVFASEGRDLRRIQYRNIRIVAMDPRQDLALLKIEDASTRPFVWIPLGDSSSIQSGQAVFAIGSPLGLDRTVSKGIISLADRYLNGRLLQQTTTQINPGNSGGPLLNLRGEVVGVNTLKVMSTGIEGMSFAVPCNTVKSFLENRSAFAFDPRNPNAGFHYLNPPRKRAPSDTTRK